MRMWRFAYLPFYSVLDIHIREGEDEFFVASCPALKGCHSQGRTLFEALDNIKDAILGYLDVESLEEFARIKADMPEFVDLEKCLSLSLDRVPITETTSSTIAHSVWTRVSRAKQVASAFAIEAPL